jgi:hypothetical protein
MDEVKLPSIPTVAYDFFGYLLPGLFFVCLIVFEYDFSKALTYYIKHNKTFDGITNSSAHYKLPYLMKFLSWEHIPTDFKLVPFLLLLISCYLLGHILAAFSSMLLEKFFLTLFIGQPSSNLFDSHSRNMGAWFRVPFRALSRNYIKPLDKEFRDKFKEVADKRFDYAVKPSEYYWLCFTDIVRKMPAYHQRIQHFVSLYGFTRNVCAAFLLYIPLRLMFRVGYWVLDIPYELHSINMVVLSLYFIVGLFLYGSYMKHYRRQTIELFYAFFSLHTDKKAKESDAKEENKD